MNPVIEELELSEPHLAAWLSSVGLGVEYVRAQGNTLFYRGTQGDEVPVLDLAGGYGSTILGHNNPELVGYAKRLLDEGTPIHAQFSRHPYANTLATKVNSIIRRELGTEDPYSAIFSNSGAEAVEAAIKHAELDRTMKLAALTEDIEANIERAHTAVRNGAWIIPEDVSAVLGSDWKASDDAGLDRLVAGIKRVNSERLVGPPVFIAPEGSFHGKLIGSVQLTHNIGFRAPFSSLATHCRFVSLDQPEALTKVIDEEKRVLLDLSLDYGVVRVIERSLPIFGAFVLEPVQGEAGIRMLDPAAVRQIRQACATIDCPIVVDEVQSGMGRTGAFFASSHIGLQGDYYTLAKSLGGGIAKAAMTLVRGSRYRKEFELVHSSTFAKDSFSTLIASRTVDLLEAHDGKAYRLAEERGKRLLTMLGALGAEFGTVVKDVRGKGLMIGLEFHDQSDSPSEIIREQARAGVLGYLLAGYLLRAQAIRIFPTASATNTLRFEPSVYLTDAEIDHVETGLRALMTTLQNQDGESLLHARADQYDH
ncbi:acetylornithine/succinyldiaminopimelate/putrescine aminotransferase [Kitasatospora sp. GAS204A]|uniref:aspartate aminotransferase family protein n=1 Tax=unclassified Kitasatospora TaxID=2633591 RepID=UPI002476DE85|nr:aminotransferase class III-fold pyridoxal phosphate-dependent enzyme [Kitasatospora sp. GAS204B]MDH6122870.1 acetylornithine/succinyldiaminopimelate/putrescine aminotransferase [Kitasatospora sp. GAS204B]